MSTEYQPDYQPESASAGVPESTPAGFSSFWPLLILTAGLLLWSGYQAESAYVQSSVLSAEFKQAQPTIAAAQNVQSRLYAVAQDLIHSSAKDPYAAQIVKESNIRFHPNDPTH
jgi:hypothetical protein